MAPAGKAVMSSFIQYTPYKLREQRLGHREGEPRRHGAGDARGFFPGFSKLVLQREVRTPLDIERTVGLSEGNILPANFSRRRVLLPAGSGWTQYRTPIDGYYQCGSGMHPGGCVMGAPGKLAGQRTLKDRSKD